MIEERRIASVITKHDGGDRVTSSCARYPRKNRRAPKGQQNGPTRPTGHRNSRVSRTRTGGDRRLMPWRVKLWQGGNQEENEEKAGENRRTWEDDDDDDGGIRTAKVSCGPVGDVRQGEGVMTIGDIVKQCGRSTIEPSAVSTPMDFLTSEAEYRRVWQVCCVTGANAAPERYSRHTERDI